MMDHEEATRDLLIKIMNEDYLIPLWKEAMAVLGDDVAIEDAMKWHAARGNEFCNDVIGDLTGNLSASKSAR